MRNDALNERVYLFPHDHAAHRVNSTNINANVVTSQPHGENDVEQQRSQTNTSQNEGIKATLITIPHLITIPGIVIKVLQVIQDRDGCP